MGGPLCPPQVPHEEVRCRGRHVARADPRGEQSVFCPKHEVPQTLFPHLEAVLATPPGWSVSQRASLQGTSGICKSFCVHRAVRPMPVVFCFAFSIHIAALDCRFLFDGCRPAHSSSWVSAACAMWCTFAARVEPADPP